MAIWVRINVQQNLDGAEFILVIVKSPRYFQQMWPGVIEHVNRNPQVSCCVTPGQRPQNIWANKGLRQDAIVGIIPGRNFERVGIEWGMLGER